MCKITVAEIMALRPCAAYPESRVRELWAGRESLSLIEILWLDIPAADRIWVLTQDGVCDRDVLMQWANGVADRAVRNHCLTCDVTAVEAWALAWLDGTDRSVSAAYAAYAADAAYAAYAADAADAAAYAADAADAAAYAADAAAYAADAAAYAADAAAYAAEREQQIQDLIAILEEK